MICRQFAPDVIDQARGIALEPRRMEALTAHLQSCASCAALGERERAMSRALRRFAEVETVPAGGDRQLQRLLQAFDAPRARPTRLHKAFEWSLAASVLIVAGLAVGWKNERPVVGSPDRIAATPAPAADAHTAFVVLPGASALPRFESGQVIRVEIPSPEGVITADVLVGQDGLARAVRLVQ
jgi:anti-sigma factor RsiW